MNGARSTFMRQGYWLTALAAIVLLAASPGTALAQPLTLVEVELDAPSKVVEGNDATITVTVEAMVEPTATGSDRAVTVTLTDLVDVTDDAVTAEFGASSQVDDAGFISNQTVIITLGAVSGTTARERTGSATVTVRTNHDGDAEDEVAVVAATSEDDSSIESVKFTIDDDEPQTYVLSLDSGTHRTSPPIENGSIVVNLKAEPAHYDDGASLTLHVIDQDGKSAKGYTPTEVVVVIGDDPTDEPDAAPGITGNVPITIAQNHSATNGDGNRVTDAITLVAYSGDAGNDALRASVDIDVLDIHGLPAGSAITAEAKDEDGEVVTEVMEGGDPVYLTITVDRGKATDRITDEELEVDIRAANGAQVADFDLTETNVTLEGSDSGEQSNDITMKIELTARPDEDVGTENLVLNLVLSGTNSRVGPETATGTFVIAMLDNTTPKVSANEKAVAYPKIMEALGNDPENTVMTPGDTGMVMTSDLFTVGEGYIVSYGASVEGDGISVSASSDTITVDAKSATGEEPAKVTVTATARMASSSFVASQTVSDVAHITFPVTVVDTPLSVMVTADPMEIDEGGTSMITATANRYVVAGDGDVEIDLLVVGDGTLDADSITIAMGAMSGSAMLTANETVTVVASGNGIDGSMQVTVDVTAAPEPEPEPEFQISAKPQDVAYPVITAAIALGAGEDEILTPGESVELMASDLFTVMDGYNATYRVSVDSTAVTGLASGDSISVTADSATVEGVPAKVTITGTAKMMAAASSFDASQDATNVASITFPVIVMVEPEPEPEPVPALPLIAQWLLGLGLMGGGARQLFRRRRQG